jgi:hypothetical protein
MYMRSHNDPHGATNDVKVISNDLRLPQDAVVGTFNSVEIITLPFGDTDES